MKKDIIKTLGEMQPRNNRKKIAIVTIDETTMWRDDIRQKAGKIEGVYLINLSEPTHLCELAISFPGLLLRNFFHNTEGFSEDELIEMEYDTAGEQVRYYNEHCQFPVVKIYWDMTEDEVIEYEQANPCYC